MQGHYSVVNKRGLITASFLMLLGILVFALSLSKRFASGSIIWTIPLVLAIIIFLLALIILISVLTAGIDIQYGKVIFANANGAGGKQPQFGISELKDIELHNHNGRILDPKTANLVGGRIVFFTEDENHEEKTYVYYPMSITARQYFKIHDGMLEMAERVREMDQS